MDAMLGLQHSAQRSLSAAILDDRRFVGGIELWDQLCAREIGNALRGSQGGKRLFEITADIGLKLHLALLRRAQLCGRFAFARLLRSPLQGNLERKTCGVAGRSVVTLNGAGA